MFKQTSNYLNSIWDLRGVPALESIVPPSSPSPLSSALLLRRAPSIWILRSPSSSRVPVCLLSSRFWLPPRRRCRRPGGPRKKHKTRISFVARVEPRFPFMSRRFRPATLSSSSPLRIAAPFGRRRGDDDDDDAGLRSRARIQFAGDKIRSRD